MGLEAYSESRARASAAKEASKVAPVFGQITVEENGEKVEKEVKVAKNGEITTEGEIWLKQTQERVVAEAAKKAEKNASGRLDRVADFFGLRPDAGTATGGSPSDKRISAQARREGDSDYLAGGT